MNRPTQPETTLEAIDGPTEVAKDLVPCVDQEVPTATYQDWLPEETIVLTCRIANDLYKGKRFESRGAAWRAVTREHGPILEANYTPGRAFFRVRRK